jgi:hypothetical protein
VECFPLRVESVINNFQMTVNCIIGTEQRLGAISEALARR